MTRPTLGAVLTALAILPAACGGSDRSPAAGAGAGLATVIDSMADTVVARVSGAVPEAAVRHLVEEVRVAPGAEDTSLFTEIGEFDVDRLGRFWAYDRPTNTIFVFDADGRFIRRIGRQGAGPGEFNNNGGMITLPDGGLAIWDGRNGRISFLDSSGVVARSWPVTTGFTTSNALVTDRTGALYLRRPVTPPREGEILGRMGLVRLIDGGAWRDSLVPPDLPVQRDVYVSRNQSGTSSTNARYAPNYYWAWHPDGYFVAANGGRGEVIIALPGGKPIAIRRDLPRVPVSDEERSEEREIILWQMRRNQPGWTWSGPPLPDAKAPIMGLSTSRDGRIWVRVAAPSVRMTDDELPPPPTFAREMPPYHFRTPLVYEVFAADGRFLGRVAFPARAALMDAEGDTVWAITRDENDLPGLARLRIEPGLR